MKKQETENEDYDSLQARGTCPQMHVKKFATVAELSEWSAHHLVYSRTITRARFLVRTYIARVQTLANARDVANVRTCLSTSHLTSLKR